jgi:polypeptide N-acetylgalactosaminyltransferase
MVYSSSSALSIRSKMLLTQLKRNPFFSAAFRYKVIIAVAVFFLFAWMSVGSLKSATGTAADLQPEHEALVQALVQPQLKGKEYPDFDYKYDQKKLRPAISVDLNEIENMLPPKRSADDGARLLYPPKGDDQRPARDFGHPEKLDNVVKKNAQVKTSYARRKNSLNGVGILRNSIPFDVVGGLDLFDDEKLDGAYDEFAADDAKIVPGLGEFGEPVKLSGEEEVLAKAVMEKEAFNLVASDKISLHRTVPDTRDPQCAAVKYDKELPTVSVIIIFTNEAWTPLLRTVWSVLDKTPPEYLHEIILVDDFSDKKHLAGKLERYIQRKFPSKVGLKRLTERKGLIKARLVGAELATGDTLLFLDSHCECGDDWVQPLLQRIKDEPRAFVVPIIDVIDDNTMEYYHGNGVYFQIGGFTWSGHFNWIDIPEHENARRGGAGSIQPTRTPTMAGGLFAVDRHYFWEIGSYDEEMEVWGGENLEMSFRVWQCGGVLETIPCSRVGHIFRSFHPYTFPGNKDTHGVNTARTVEVWMDEYKRLFYMNRPDLIAADIGKVDSRNEFKSKMQCKPFKWYLDNVFPQKFILDDPDHVFAYGRVKNPDSGACFDTMQNDEKDSYELGIYPCHNFVAASQFFSFSKKLELRREDSCAEVSQFGGASGGVERVKMVACHGNGGAQAWIHTKQGRLIHKETNKCLDAKKGADELVAAPCKALDSQIFFFDNYIS